MNERKQNKEIQISTTGIVISPYHKNQNYYIEKLTSTYDAIRHKRNPFTGLLLDYDETPPCFVTHLHDPVFLQAQFPDYQVNYLPTIKAHALNKLFRLDDSITPKEVQYEIIQQIINLEKKKQWFVYLSQGLGKTLLTIYLISYFNQKTLVMCYNKDILSQWVSSMKKNSTIDSSEILYIESSVLLKKIIYGDFPVNEYSVFLCTPGLLNSFGKKYGFYMLNVLMEKMHVGLKVYDEAHRNISNMIKINAFTSVDKTIYLSGDFGQSDKTKEVMYYNIFHNVPIIKPSEDLMNTLKFTQCILVQYDSHPTELDKVSVYSKRGFSFFEYMKYQFQKDIFFHVLEYILNMIEKTNENHYKILILVNLIEHVDELYNRLNEKYNVTYDIGKYHSGVSDIEKDYCRDNCNMIVSTYQSFSTGIDVSLIKYVISCSICTKIEDNQSSGRARPLPDGSDAFYFMFADMGFPYTKKKLKMRLNYLEETKIKSITRIAVDEDA